MTAKKKKKKKFAVIRIPVLQVAGFALFFKKRRKKKGNSELDNSFFTILTAKE